MNKQKTFSLGSMMLVEQALTDWSLMVPVGTTKEDLTNPKSYIELASRLSLMGKKPYQFPRVHVTDMEGNFFATVIIIGNANGIVTAHVHSFSEVGEVTAEIEVPAKPVDEVSDVVIPSDEEKADSADAASIESFDDRFQQAKDQTQLHFIKHRGAGKWQVINRDTTEAVESELTKEQAVEAHSKYLV